MACDVVSSGVGKASCPLPGLLGLSPEKHRGLWFQEAEFPLKIALPEGVRRASWQGHSHVAGAPEALRGCSKMKAPGSGLLKQHHGLLGVFLGVNGSPHGPDDGVQKSHFSANEFMTKLKRPLSTSLCFPIDLL